MFVALAYPGDFTSDAPYFAGQPFATLDWPDAVGRDHWPQLLYGPSPQNVGDAAIHLANMGPDLVIPLTEEAVLAAAKATSYLGIKRGLNQSTARKCTDRRAQRIALEKTGFNPRWWVYGDEPFPARTVLVAKTPASTLSRGVQIVDAQTSILGAVKFLTHNARDEISRLTLAGMVPDYAVILEEFIEGTQFEVSGISTTDVRFVFRPLRQQWGEPARFIDAYEPVDGALAYELIDVAVEVVETLGLTWCGWNVEIKGPPWKVIEVHCRLGEDGKGYSDALDPDMDPLMRLCLTIEADL